MYYYDPQISPENKQEAYSIKCFYRGETGDLGIEIEGDF